MNKIHVKPDNNKEYNHKTDIEEETSQYNASVSSQQITQ